LSDNAGEYVGEYGSFAVVGVIGQWQTLLETVFGVGAHKMGKAGDDELPKLRFSFGYSIPLQHED
jgi:hypothetical protein